MINLIKWIFYLIVLGEFPHKHTWGEWACEEAAPYTHHTQYGEQYDYVIRYARRCTTCHHREMISVNRQCTKDELKNFPTEHKALRIQLGITE